jgi:hypothetical protein
MFVNHIIVVELADWGALHVSFHTTSMWMMSGTLTYVLEAAAAAGLGLE